MVQTKYLVIFGVIVCLLILYYFYSEITSIKKSVVPIYQKTMTLESKIYDIEKITSNFLPKKSKSKNDSSHDSLVYSMSYQSDMVRNGNLSVAYANLSDTAAKEVIKNIEKNKNTSQKKSPQKVTPQKDTLHSTIKSPSSNKSLSSHKSPPSNRAYHVLSGDLSELDDLLGNGKKNKLSESMYTDMSDTINIKYSDLIKKPAHEFVCQPNYINEENNLKEYQEILDNLTTSLPGLCSPNDDFNEDTIDQDIVKSISESINYADIPSESTFTEVSDKKNHIERVAKNIPKKPSKKKQTVSK